MEGYGFINLGYLDLICNLALPRLSGIKVYTGCQTTTDHLIFNSCDLLHCKTKQKFYNVY